MTTSRGPFDPDVFFVLSYDDGLLNRLQRLPGVDNETFIRAMAVSDEAISVLWRRSGGGDSTRP